MDRLLAGLQSLPLAVADLKRQHQALTAQLAGLTCENNELRGRIARLVDCLSTHPSDLDRAMSCPGSAAEAALMIGGHA